MENNELVPVYEQSVKRLVSTEKAMNTTRNLSVFIVAGMMYFIFGFPQTSSHLIAILGSLTIFVLQIFESRIYQMNYKYNRIVTLIENVLSGKLTDFQDGPMESLNALTPPVSFVYAFAATTWKNYILIFLTLDVCWFSKLYLFPVAAASWSEFFNRPAFGFLPGWFFYAFAGAFWIIYFTLGIWYKLKSKNEKLNYS